MLRWMQSLYFGKPTVMNTHPKDIGWGHVFQALPLIFLIFWIGIYPSLVLNEIKPVDTILEQKQ
jgi:NADH:ubiquinone oxidoreductase subunit 4 (subunit M)